MVELNQPALLRVFRGNAVAEPDSRNPDGFRSQHIQNLLVNNSSRYQKSRIVMLNLIIVFNFVHRHGGQLFTKRLKLLGCKPIPVCLLHPLFDHIDDTLTGGNQVLNLPVLQIHLLKCIKLVVHQFVNHLRYHVVIDLPVRRHLTESMDSQNQVLG